MMNNQYFWTSILIIFTLITLFFSLRIFYPGLMLNNFEKIWINSFTVNKNQMMTYMFISTMSILGLPLISILFLMF